MSIGEGHGAGVHLKHITRGASLRGDPFIDVTSWRSWGVAHLKDVISGKSWRGDLFSDVTRRRSWAGAHLKDESWWFKENYGDGTLSVKWPDGATKRVFSEMGPLSVMSPEYKSQDRAHCSDVTRRTSQGGVLLSDVLRRMSSRWEPFSGQIRSSLAMAFLTEVTRGRSQEWGPSQWCHQEKVIGKSFYLCCHLKNVM